MSRGLGSSSLTAARLRKEHDQIVQLRYALAQKPE